MEKLIEFLLRETPAHAKELKSDIGLLLSSLENTQSAVEGMLRQIDKSDYAKIGEYYSMADSLRNVKERIAELDQSICEKDSIEQEDEDELQGVSCDEKKSYEDCRVDDTVPHGLFEDFTHKRPIAFSLDGIKYSARDWKQILRILCEVLNQKDSRIFDSFVRDKNMQGHSRVYFAYTDDHMYNGRKVSGSNIYIETNHNANGICSIIGNMLERYNIPVTAIQIYLRSDYSPLHSEDDNVKKLDIANNDTDTEIKIGQYAREYFAKYFSDTSKYYDLKNFLNKYWCNENFGICYPLLKEVDITRPITDQKNYNNEYGRYWTKPVLKINGKDYILCSQWFRGFQPKLDKWIESQLSVPVPIVKRDKTRCIEYDFKKDVCMCSYAGNFMMQCEGINGCTYYKEQMPVYIIPKAMSKQGKCPCCGKNFKTEFLIVTYKREKSSTHKLISSRCENCEQNYVSDSIFATYTQNKNLEDLDVRFIPITKLK